MSNDSNRRRFMQLTAGGLVVSAALTSPDTTSAGPGAATEAVNPITGNVLRTSGQLSLDAKSLIEAERPIPVVGTSEILVCGAGPAGIAAALSAARAGASVQLIEVAGCLGGVWTVGLLTKILDAGNKQGIMKELLRKFTDRGSQVAIDSQGTVYDPEIAKLVLEEVCVEAGIKIRLHTRLVGAVLNEKKQLVAALTESKSGREAWLAERFIDCTGDGDLAAHAGCQFEVGTGSDCTCQPMSMLALLTGLDPEQVRPWIRETGSVAKKRLLELMESHGINPSYRAPTLRHLHSNIFSLMTNHEYGVSAFDADAITAATLRARKEIHEIVDGLRSIGGPWKDLAVVATAEQLGVREGRRVRGALHPDRVGSDTRTEPPRGCLQSDLPNRCPCFECRRQQRDQSRFQNQRHETLRHSLSRIGGSRCGRTVDGRALHQRRLHRPFQLPRDRQCCSHG